MSNPWNTTSSIEKEPELLEIMSEELSQRLQIEDDYVWVNLHEVQQQIGKVATDVAASDSTTNNESSIAQNVKNIVQSEASNINLGDEEATENIYNDSDSDIDETDTEEEPDKVDELEYKTYSEKSVNMLKVAYPMPQWLKQKEHGTSRIYSSDKNQNNKKVNPLLPEIKFDASTTKVLERLIKNRYLGQYNEVIGRGKNSIVFHAHCHRYNCISMPVNNAVKVYNVNKNKENNKLIFRRVQREFDHLKIVRRHSNAHCTYIQPIRAWENVLVMSFIGFDTTIAPSIQDLPFSLINGKDTNMYYAILSFMHKCYNVMHLVHGKLCDRNIRCWFERPHFIGWGHSVKTDHPQALPKLIKDCKFVTEFYARRGVRVKSTEDLFKEITGCSKISSKLLKSINSKDLYEIYDQNPNRSSSPKGLNNNLRFKCN